MAFCFSLQNENGEEFPCVDFRYQIGFNFLRNSKTKKKEKKPEDPKFSEGK